MDIAFVDPDAIYRWCAAWNKRMIPKRNALVRWLRRRGAVAGKAYDDAHRPGNRFPQNQLEGWWIPFALGGIAYTASFRANGAGVAYQIKKDGGGRVWRADTLPALQENFFGQ